MTASTTMQESRPGSPCGCGGSGASPASPCTCGGGGCSLCQNQGYARPRFFAGQLLTEDDLQQLNEYAVGKNRLHARYLFGPGVVCGLEVTCFPCGGGKVIVNPGYALDCCGNDIVLPCPKELDINAMVRELKRKQRGGFDCGDPCAKPEARPTGQRQETSKTDGSTSAEGEATGATLPKDGNELDTKKPEEHLRKYCLYVNYCEQPSDPVSPYSTDDPCGQQTCEPTRIREGFRFELRCPDLAEPEPEICRRFHECLGDPTALEKTRVESTRFAEYGQKLETVHKSIQALPKLVLGSSELKTLAESLEQKALELDSPLNTLKGKPDASKVQPFLDALLSLGSDFAKIRLQPREAQEAFRKECGAVWDAATSGLGSATGHEVSQVLQKALPVAVDHEHAKALFEVVQKLIPKVQVEETPPTTAAWEFEPVQLEDFDVRVLAEGAVHTADFHNFAARSFVSIRDWLVDRVEQAAGKTHCSMLDTINAAPMPRMILQGQFRETSPSDIQSFSRSAAIFHRAVEHIELSCFCDLLNPPCPPCEDTGVLLACLTVEDCKVKDICNLDRRFVLSPVAIRYWIPEIQRLGGALEKACCPSPCPETEGGQSQFAWRTYLPHLKGFDVYLRLAEWVLRLGCPEKEPGAAYLKNQALRALSSLLMSMSVPLEGERAEVAVAPEARAPVSMETATDTVRVELVRSLRHAQSELDKLRSEYHKLHERVLKLERKKTQDA